MGPSCLPRIALVVALASVLARAPLGSAPAVQDPHRIATLERTVNDNPTDGRAWNRLGHARHTAGHWDQAREAFLRSIELGVERSSSMYDIACGHALAGQGEQAIDWIDRALDAGFQQVDLFHSDSDLDSIRHDPVFRERTGVFPSPELTRDERWRHDLAFFSRRMEEVHHDLFGKVTREAWTRAVAELVERVPQLSDTRLALEIQGLCALVGDGHTALRLRAPAHAHPGLGPGGLDLNLHRLPVKLWWFADGVFVTHAADRRLLGARVLSLGSRPIEGLLEDLAPRCSVDNSMGVRLQAPGMLTTPEVLQALGATDDPGAVPMEVETTGGERLELTLEARAPNDSTPLPGADEGLERPLTLDSRGPYWFEHLPELDLVYCQYNVVQNVGLESLESFWGRLFELVEQQEVDALVIDMRSNGGGDLHNNLALVRGLVRCERIDREGHLYVMIGRRTFSAAMNGVAQIEKYSSPIFVGEPTGSSPNFVGETTPIRLPCSGLTISCSSLAWQGTYAYDERTWIAPDLYAERTSADFLAGRDPAWERVLEHLRERRAR